MKTASPILLVITLTLSALTAVSAQQPKTSSQVAPTAQKVLLSAKTLCVLVPPDNADLKTGISKKLIRSGKLTLVADPVKADLVLKVEVTGQLDPVNGGGNQAAAILTQRESGQELWRVTKGGSWAMSGISYAWVGRAIASDFIKHYDSAAKMAKK